MTAKMEEPIFHVRGWIKDWIAIAVTRYSLNMIHWSCLPSPVRDREMTRNWFWGWYWRNELHARIFCAQPHKNSSLPAQPFISLPFFYRSMHKHYICTKDKGSHPINVNRKWQKNKRKNKNNMKEGYQRKDLTFWRKNMGPVRKWDGKIWKLKL